MAPTPTPRRMAPKPYSDDTSWGRSQLSWQVFLRDKWEKVDTADAKELEQAYSKGFDRFHVRLRNQVCVVSLAENPWIHIDSSGVSHPIRRWMNRPRSGAATIPDEVETSPECSDDHVPTAHSNDDSYSLEEEDSEGKMDQNSGFDIDRIFIWRSNDWHPVSQNLTQQIQANLTDGAKVFDIKEGPYEWVIDTTEREGWVQISKITGRRWPLKCQLDTTAYPTPRLPRQGKSSVTSLRKISPRIVSTEGDSASESSTRLPGVMLAERLREEWSAMKNKISISRKGLAVTCLDKCEMIETWIEAYGWAGAEYRNLITQTIADIFLKVDLSRNGLIEEAEWMHYFMLESQAPSFHALSQVNEKLLTWLEYDAMVLEKLNNIFSQNACGQDDAQITAMQMRIAATSWLSDMYKSELGNARMTKFQLDIGEHLAELTSSEHMLDEDELLTYYDFMNHMLGRRKAPVQIYQYDLSKGSAKLLSSALVGRQLDGIWHTSVVVFNKEYWLGGKVFESEPGTTPFGTPSKIIDMPESTMRTKTDFLQFLQRHLTHQFSAETYDVLTHNCNHFSDAVTMFLLNTHIPQEILSQSELISTDTWTMQLLRPLLNCALGRFEATSSTRDLHLSAREVSDMGNMCPSSIEGSLVLWEHDKGWTRIAMVSSYSPEKETCTLKWLDIHSGQLRTEIGVRRCELQKLQERDDLVPSNWTIGGNFEARFQRLTISC